MSAWEPNCRDAEDDLVRVFCELRDRGLLKNAYSDEEVRRALTWCARCRGRNPSSRKCTGWRVSFYGTQTIEMPFEVKGRHLVAKITGELSFARERPAKFSEWQAAPVSKASCAIEIWQITGSNALVRHHLDLANLDQMGPVWHLQLGGLASEGARRRDLEWLDVPRWPAMPMDLVLFLELAIYSFHPDCWAELCATNPWRDIVKRSELLMLHHYRDRIGGYFNRAEVAHSWLARQCNRSSDWNPRPAAVKKAR